MLRSKSPDLVTQEIWGHLCCHYAIRTLMFDAAVDAGRDPDRVSFVAALRISRRSIAQAGAFPPEVTEHTSSTPPPPHRPGGSSENSGHHQIPGRMTVPRV